MQNTTTEFSVISHTHWDREWHMSFERFRMRLVALIDNLLDILEDDPEYIFHLDAQSICVEDYLAIRPDKAAIVRTHIEDGRILIGPWYVQNDFYLTSGEATVRNLLIGKRMAEAYGKCDTVGYAPDQFGNISQLPQIIGGFGIDNFVFGRGYSFPENPGIDREKKVLPTEFIWESKDGSELLAIHLPFWYNNAQRFPDDIDKSLALVLGNEEDFRGRAATPHILLMNGVDHLEAQEDLMPILDHIGERLPNGKRIGQDTLSRYIDKVRKYVKRSDVALTRYKGELRNGWDIQTHLANTASSRIYLKTQNVQAQVLLENHLEPLYSMISLLGAEDAYPYDYLRYLWKTLIQNHPHDSICGCSVDEVHRAMEDRNLRIFEAGDELLDRGLALLSDLADRDRMDRSDYVITVANTLSRKRSSCIDMDLIFRQEDGVTGFEISTLDGEPIEHVVLEKEASFFSSLSPINLPGNLDVDRFRTRIFLPDVPAFSVSYFKVTPVATNGAAALPNPRQVRSAKVGNEYLEFSIDEAGGGVLTDRRNERTYEDFFELEETGDMGNSYEFIQPEEGRVYTTDDMTVTGLTHVQTAVSEEISVTYAVEFPESYDFRQNARSRQTVENIITLTFVLNKQSPYLEIKCEVKNRSRDHRLRIVFESGIASDTVQVAAPFEMVDRCNTEYVAHWNSGDCPNSGFVSVSDKIHGMSILNEGVAEYKHLEDGRIAFTLVRSTGAVNGNIATQSDHWLCPENQTLRDISLRLAIYPHKNDALAADTSKVHQEFLVPMLAHYDSCDMTKFAGGRAPVQASGVAEHFFREPKHRHITPAAVNEVLRIHGKHLVLSALKRSEDGRKQILRVYNEAETASSLIVEAADDLATAELVTLEEKVVRDIRIDGNTTEAVPVGPGQIITLAFT
jgi:alpha-mannosidase